MIPCLFQGFLSVIFWLNNFHHLGVDAKQFCCQTSLENGVSCFPVSVEKIHILGVVTGSVSVLQYHWFSLASKILIPHLVVITGYNWDEIHSINGVFQFWKSRSFPWFFVVSPSNSSVFIAGILPWQVHQVHRRRAVFVQGHGALTVLKLGYSVRHRTVAVCCLNGLVFIGKILYN